MCEKCIRICNAIGELNSAGHDVTIRADNPVFYEQNSQVDVGFNFGAITETFHAGSVVEALENAVEYVRQSGG